MSSSRVQTPELRSRQAGPFDEPPVAWGDVIDEVTHRDGQRPSREPTKWDLTKIRTRRRIMLAGRQLFARHGYEAPKVHDIAQAAGISRAAFYLHFKSLDELMVAVFRREVRWQLRRYRSLDAATLRDRHAIRAWLQRFYDSFREERDYVLIIYRTLAMDPANLQLISRERDAMIRHLGRRIPELHLFDGSGRRIEKRFAHLHQITRRLEDISLYTAFNSWTNNVELSIENVRDELFAFAKEAA